MDDAVNTAWNNLDSNIQGGITFIRQALFGFETPLAYAEGAAESKVKDRFAEFGEDLGIAADQLAGTISEILTNIAAWFTGDSGDDTDGLENLQELTQKITWKSGTEKVPGETEIGIGPSSVNTLYFSAPDGKDVHFREGGTDVMIIKPGEVKFYQPPMPDADKSRSLGSDGVRWNVAYVDDVDIEDRLKFRSNSISNSSASDGEMWYDGTTIKAKMGGDVKELSDIGSGGDAPGLSLLTVPITWSTQNDRTADDAKTGGADNENNIGFDNANNFYIKMKGTKMIVKAGDTDVLDVSSSRFQVEGNLTPSESRGANLGLSSNRWDEIHAQSLKLYESPGLIAGAGSINIGTDGDRFGVGYFGSLHATNYSIAKIFVANSSTSDPTDITNGTIWQKGGNVFVQTGGGKKNLSNIGTSGSSGTTSVPDPLTVNKLTVNSTFQHGNTSAQFGTFGVGATQQNVLKFTSFGSLDFIQVGNKINNIITALQQYGLLLK